MGVVIVKGEWSVLGVNFGHPIVTSGDFVVSEDVLNFVIYAGV